MDDAATARLPVTALAAGLVAGVVAVAALAFAAAAQAQTTAVCSDTPAAGERILCSEDDPSTDDIGIDASGLAIETTADQESGIEAFHAGEGDIRIESRSNTITTAGQSSRGIGASHTGGTGDVSLRVSSTDIRTNRTGAGAYAHGIFGRTTASGRLDAVVTGGSIVTLGQYSHGIALEHAFAGSGAAGALTLDIGGGIAIETSGEIAYGILAQRKSDGDIRLTLRDAAIDTAGAGSLGVYAFLNNDPKPDIAGDVRIDLLGGVRIATEGANAIGIVAQARGNDRAVRGDVTVTARGDNSIVTEGDDARGVTAQNTRGGAGDVLLDLRGLSVTTGGKDAHGLSTLHQGPGNIDIRLSGGSVTTKGVGARGIIASRNEGGPGDLRILARNHRIVTESTEVDATSQDTASHGIEAAHDSQGDIVIDLRGGSIETGGVRSFGIHAAHGGLGDIVIDLRGGSIETGGVRSHGIHAVHDSQGDIVIDLRGGSIETRGVQSYGVRAIHWQAENGGDISIRTGGGHSIATAGASAHGIFTLNFGTTAGTSAIFIDVGGSVRAGGAHAHGVAAGGLSANRVVTGASPLGADGYRRQTVRVNGRVYGGTGTGAGISLAGGGRVFIGPRGLVGALSGVAVRAVGNTVVDGETVPRRLWVELMPDGRSPAGLLDGTVVNEGGETVLAVNGTPLYDSAEGGRTGLWAPNGARDVTLVEGFTGLDFSSADSFIDRYAARVAVYEALPGALLRLDEAGSIGAGGGGARLRQPGSPLWLRLSGGRGRFKPGRATVGGRLRYTRYAAEARMDFRLAEGLTGRAGARLVEGAAHVSSSAGSGRIAATGHGLFGGLAWRDDDGLYGAGRLSLTRYKADISSAARGGLKEGASGLAHALDLEGGRRFELGGGSWLTARAWLGSAGVSMDDFADAVGSRVSVERAGRVLGGVGASAGMRFEPKDGGESLELAGGLGMERTLSEESEVVVSRETLEAGDTAPRLLLDLGGTWQSGDLSLHAALQAKGLLSDSEAYGANLQLRVAF